MKFLIVLALLAATVAGSVDFGKVRPRHFDTRRPIVPRGRIPVEGRITNGQPASIKQIPYQVGLLLAYPEGNYWCGGTLLSDSWVLTAAHCTDGVLYLQVNLGTLRSSPEGDVGEVVILVDGSDVIVHKDYDDYSLENDVSLIKLPEPVTFTDYIKPASLPKFTGTAPTYASSLGIASGWGLVSDSSSNISLLLQYADVPVITNAKCSTYYGRLAKSVLCISTEGTKKSICSGDSGGPLVLDGTDTLIGVTSFGVIYGCEVEWPAGFSRVTSFLDWIAQNSGITP